MHAIQILIFIYIKSLIRQKRSATKEFVLPAIQILDQSIGLDSNLNLCDATLSNLIAGDPQRWGAVHVQGLKLCRQCRPCGGNNCARWNSFLFFLGLYS